MATDRLFDDLPAIGLTPASLRNVTHPKNADEAHDHHDHDVGNVIEKRKAG